MKKTLIYFFSILLNLSFISPIFSKDASQFAVPVKNKMEIIEGKLKDGRKVSLSESLTAKNSDKIVGQYVIAVKDNSVDSVLLELKKKYKFTVIPQKFKSLSGITFLVVKLEKDTLDFATYANTLTGVLYIENNVKRESTVVPSMNDPLLPVDNSYEDQNKQWYLNKPENGNVGIDIKRAWEYLDSKGINYGGTGDVVVAVLDTGVAYENYSKYNQHYLMNAPTAWQFSKSLDFTDNIFNNVDEIAGNNMDDDFDGYSWGIDEDFYQTYKYCLDLNADWYCDTIAGALLNDVHGANIIDWDSYWKIWSYDLIFSPICLDNGNVENLRCIQEIRCTTPGGDNANYFGCNNYDMGHPNDTNGHGTFVSNIISSKGNNANSGVGIAPGVSIMPVKVLGDLWDGSSNIWIEDGGSTSVNVAYGILYATFQGADVINLSLGGIEPSFFDYIAILEAEANGTVVVASSGNEGVNEVSYPAAYTTVLAVGASNLNGSKSSYSNYGSNLDLVAPVGEEGIVSESYDCFFTQECEPDSQILSVPSQYSSFASAKAPGTSFSAPQVSAVAALVKSLHPDWTPYQIRYALVMSAVPTTVDKKPDSLTGFGVLNAFNAVRGVDYLGRDLFDREDENNSQNAIYETKLLSGYLYYRKSTDNGVTKSAWTKLSHTTVLNANANFTYVSGLETTANRTLVTYIGSNKKIYTRYTDDHVIWSSPIGGGYSISAVSVKSIGPRVIQSTKYYGGTYNNHVRTRISDDGGETWGLWTGPGLSSSVTITDMVSMSYIPHSGTLVQGVRSMNNGLWVRYSTTLGDTWSPWTRLAAAYVTPSLSVSGTNLYLSMIGWGGKILTRVSRDGGKTWDANWILNGYTNGWIYTVPDHTGGAIQSVKWSTSEIFTRYTTDGTNFSGWVKQTLPGGSKASSGLRLHKTRQGAFLSVVASDKNVYFKYSLDNGVNWSAWVKAYNSSNSYSVYFDPANGRLFEYALRLDGNLYTRYSDDGGQSWAPQIKDSSTKTAVSAGFSPIAKSNIDF